MSKLKRNTLIAKACSLYFYFLFSKNKKVKLNFDMQILLSIGASQD